MYLTKTKPPMDSTLPVEQLSPGLYWISQHSQAKGVEHHAILDVGNRARISNSEVAHLAVIIHQTPPSITCQPFNGTGNWKLLKKIEDEQGAILRLRAACGNPIYSMIDNNCEHFARYIATSTRESHQVQVVGLLSILFGLALTAAHK